MIAETAFAKGENQDIKQEALKKHYEWQGKLEITPRTHVTNSLELSLAYTPGGGGAVPGPFGMTMKRALR